MAELKEILLPSGATLKVQLSPLIDAKALLSAVLEESKNLKIESQTDIDLGLLKDIVCAGFSSPKIDKALTACMKRALYNDLKIDDKTFEPEDARQDYLIVCFEVAKANLLPFMKSLSAKFGQVVGLLGKDQKSA